MSSETVPPPPSKSYLDRVLLVLGMPLASTSSIRHSLMLMMPLYWGGSSADLK